MKAVVQSPFSLERAGLAGIVRQVWPKSEVIETADGEDLVRRALPDDGPQLVLVDWRSSRIAEQVIGAVRSGAGEDGPSIVVFCDAPDLQTAQYLMRLGVKAVAPLTMSPTVIPALLTFVAAGGTYISPSVIASGEVSAPAADPGRNGQASHPRLDDSAFHGLTRRQKEVLRLISRGHSNDEIAVELGVTLNTVKSHVSSMLRALGVKRRTQAIRLLSDRAAP